MRQGRLFPDFWKALYEVKAVVYSFVSIILIGLYLTYNKKTAQNFRLLIQRYDQFNFLVKGLEIVSPPHILRMIFQGKFFSFYILLTDQVWLSDFTSWYIGQYVYCSLLFHRLWRHKFRN